MNSHQLIPSPDPRQPTISSGLWSLASLPLTESNQKLLDRAAVSAGGPAPWRYRKLKDARDILALEQLAPETRLKVLALDLRESLRVWLLMRVPVPCRVGDADLVVHKWADLGLTYRQEALWQPQPGFSFIQILQPRAVWHPNVSYDAFQVLCLGPNLPAGIPVVLLLLMAYGALTFQSVQTDEQDPAGVMNAAAAQWWQENRHRIPLSKTPFLGAETEPAKPPTRFVGPDLLAALLSKSVAPVNPPSAETASSEQ